MESFPTTWMIMADARGTFFSYCVPFSFEADSLTKRPLKSVHFSWVLSGVDSWETSWVLHKWIRWFRGRCVRIQQLHFCKDRLTQHFTLLHVLIYMYIFRERERYQYATPNISEHTVNVSEKDVVFGLRCLQLRPTGFILMGVGVSLFFWCSLNWQVLNEHPSELPDFDRRSINGIPFKGIGLVPIQERFPHASLPPEQVGKAILPRLVSKRFYCYPGLPLFTATAESCFCCVVQTCSDHSDMNMELFKDRIWYFVLQIWKLKPLL